MMVGNPGVGKSTLLNGVTGKAHFHSGDSPGQGMTTVLQLIKADDGVWYGDTPGLADVNLREQAAVEISKALRSGEGDYKIVFVVTEEAARVRPPDNVTIKLVLDALPKDKKISYGIVVNKLSKKLKERLETEPGFSNEFFTCLNQGRDHPTAYIHLYGRNDDLENETDRLHEPTPAFRQFLQMLPAVRIKPEEVADVQASEFAALQEKFEAELLRLRGDKDALQVQMDKDKEELTNQIADMRAAHAQALEEAKARANSSNPFLDILGAIVPIVGIVTAAFKK